MMQRRFIRRISWESPRCIAFKAIVRVREPHRIYLLLVVRRLAVQIAAIPGVGRQDDAAGHVDGLVHREAPQQLRVVGVRRKRDPGTRGDQLAPLVQRNQRAAGVPLVQRRLRGGLREVRDDGVVDVRLDGLAEGVGVGEERGGAVGERGEGVVRHPAVAEALGVAQEGEGLRAAGVGEGGVGVGALDAVRGDDGEGAGVLAGGVRGGVGRGELDDGGEGALAF